MSTIDIGTLNAQVVNVSGGIVASSLNVAGVLINSNVFVNGLHTIWIPAGNFTTRTSNGPASNTVQTTTNLVMIPTLDFDATAQEFAQAHIQMPKSWDEGNVYAQAVWTHGNTATPFGVVWAVQAVAMGDADIFDVAFGTEQTMTDTGGTNNAVYITPISNPIQVGGSPGSEELVVYQVKRNPADGSDTLTVDARLVGIKILYNTPSGTDN